MCVRNAVLNPQKDYHIQSCPVISFVFFFLPAFDVLLCLAPGLQCAYSNLHINASVCVYVFLGMGLKALRLPNEA